MSRSLNSKTWSWIEKSEYNHCYVKTANPKCGGRGILVAALFSIATKTASDEILGQPVFSETPKLPLK